ncbi:MAG: zinc ribbon domain-containing protein [Clostridia bacterium]|nr:zinc ribbon domain-containing protein [Clostridia bacterium]
MDWKKSITDTVRNIGDKAKDISENIGDKLETSKLKSQIDKLEKEISNNYKSIGILYYEQIRENTLAEAEIQRLCDSIVELKKDIAVLEEKIVDLNED